MTVPDLATLENGPWGLYDTRDDCWFGSATGPTIFANTPAAFLIGQCAEVVVNERLGTVNDVRLCAFREEGLLVKDEITPRENHGTSHGAARTVSDWNPDEDAWQARLDAAMERLGVPFDPHDVDDKYILDEEGNVVPERDLFKWAAWFSDRPGVRIVRRHERKAWSITFWKWTITFRKNIAVSTVFLGMDHGFARMFGDDDAPPVLWETMIFGTRAYDDHQQRYSSLADALEGHHLAATLALGVDYAKYDVKDELVAQIARQYEAYKK